MTIDEAIEEYKIRVKNDRQAESLFLHDDLIWNAKQEHKLAEHHEQLAEWLEELKALKSDDNLIFRDGLEQGYNKAIDDFAEKMSDECFEQSMTVVFENRVKADVLTLDGLTEIIFEIAEQLKKGGTNERV